MVAVKACVADGIRGAMGATNKRFRLIELTDGTATFSYKGRAVRIKLSELTQFHDADEVFRAEEDQVIDRVEKLIFLTMLSSQRLDHIDQIFTFYA